MKKIYYLLMCFAAVAVLASCDPMSKTYKQLDDNPTPSVKTLTYTLTPTDYSLLPSSSAAYKAKAFRGTTDANAGIPTILNAKFVFGYDNGSNANITFTPATSNIIQTDSVYADLKYTLVNNADYLLLPGNKFADFSVAQLLTWLPYKYPNPVANEQHLLTWIFYPTIATTAPQIYPGLGISSTVSGTTTTTLATGSFAYINGAWVQCYYINPTQYAATGHGQYNEFTSSDDATLVSQLNGILKADAGIMGTAKVGSVQYVSYNYYSSTKITSQRLMALYFDGTNWSRTAATSTLSFVKKNGTWVPDPTIYYTLKSSDWAVVGNSTAGTTLGRSNFAQYGDFNQQTGSTYYWSDADIQLAIIAVLKADFPSPVVNNPYKISYLVYTGSDATKTVTYIYNGTAWVIQQ